MKYLILPFCFFFLFTIVCFSQIEDIHKINDAKLKLENLQKDLWQIDSDQRAEILRLEKENQVKGEFETTKQFEERKSKVFDRISEISLELREQNGTPRFVIQKQINEILMTEYEGNIELELGQYDADSQLFPIRLSNGLSFESLFVPLAEAKNFKENFVEAKVVGKTGLLLDKNGRAQPFLLFAKINFRGKTYQNVPINLNLEKALNIIYGNYNSSSKTSSWKLYETEDSEIYSLTEVSAKSVFFKPFQENGTQKILLVTQTEKANGGCHACGAIMGVAVFSKKDNYWKVDSAQKNLGEQGRWGELDQPSLARLGKEKFALKFSWGDMHQGYINEGEYYFALDDNLFREILSYGTTEDSSASSVLPEDQILVKSKVSTSVGNHPNYYDVKILTFGKKAMKIGQKFILRPYSKTSTYTYVGDKYQLVK